MIGEVEALLDERVGINQSMLARPFARVQQHVLDDGVCALAVLHDLVEIVAQGVRQFGYFGQRITIDLHFAESFLQFVDQLDRDTGEIIDEIERVFDLVSDAGGKLAERSQLLCLDKPILRGPQIFQRFS
jgi:hypothetical protein